MMKHRIALRLAAPVVAVATVFALSACANPIEQLIKQGTSGAIENLIEQSTDGKVDVDPDGGISIQTEDGKSIDFGGSASMPETWPDLPVPDGELVASYSSSTEFALTFTTTQAEVDKMVDRLKQQGFAETGTVDLGDIKNLTLESSQHQVVLSSIAEGEGKVSLQYMVFPTSN